MATRTDTATEEIERRIVTGEYPAGTRLPNEGDLAASVNVSRTTLREAMGRLEARGLVTREQGRGTFVRARSGLNIAMLLEANLSVSDMIREMGLEPATKEVRVGIEVPPPHVAGAMGLSDNDPVLVVHRLRTADGVPAVFSDDYLVIVPGLPRDRDSYWGSLYELLAAVYGRRVASGHARLRAGQATGALAESLGVADGALTLILSQVHHLADGTAVMYSDAHLLNDAFSVHVRRGSADRELLAHAQVGPDGANEEGGEEVPIGST